MEPAPGLLPIYFLPWMSAKLTQLTIPEIPSNLADWDDDEFPRFFFTSGLSGCTVFIDGTTKNPTIHHGGVSEMKIQGDSDQFWIDQMVALDTGYDKSILKSVVKSSEYLPPDRASMHNYLRWLETDSPNSAVEFEVIECGACVFGIRFHKDWTFYIQETIASKKVRFVSQKQVKSKKDDVLGKVFHTKDTNESAKLARLTKTPRTIGPFRFGTKMQSVYRVEQLPSIKPIGVREVFPKKTSTMLPNRYTVKVTAT